MYRTVLYITIFLIVYQSNFAQGQWNTSSKKAIKNIEEGLKQMGLRNYTEAIKRFEKAISADNQFVEAFLSLGQLYEEKPDYQKAAEYYRKGHEISPGLFKQTLMSLGRSCFKTGDYECAKEAFEGYLNQKGISTKSRFLANKYLKNCIFAIRAKMNPVPFKPVNLGDSINTSYHEYWPSISADEEILVFTSRVPLSEEMNAKMGFWQEDFFISRKKDGIWTKAENMGGPINTKENEGAQSIMQ